MAVVLDNTIYSAFFVAEEGTMSSFTGLRQVIERRGAGDRDLHRDAGAPRQLDEA